MSETPMSAERLAEITQWLDEADIGASNKFPAAMVIRELLAEVERLGAAFNEQQQQTLRVELIARTRVGDLEAQLAAAVELAKQPCSCRAITLIEDSFACQRCRKISALQQAAAAYTKRVRRETAQECAKTAEVLYYGAANAIRCKFGLEDKP